jgi:hypothetical protein
MKIILFTILAVLITSCVKNKNFRNVENSAVTDKNAFVVTEVIQTSKYTYLKVKENASERWVAVIRQEAKAGELYYYNGVLQMNNFYSKELNRNFDEIFFLSQISKTPVGLSGESTMPAHTGKVDVQANGSVKLVKGKNEVTIARIFENRSEYAGKVTEIRGIVVKINQSVMDKNWVHIQDGTEFSGNSDLTVTTQDLAEIGDEVTFRGKIIIDKSFGSGYFYEVIMENATLVSTKTQK